MIQSLPVGTPVWWYNDMTSSTPLAATITRTEGTEGMVSLAIWPPNSLTPLLRRGVRHKKDPWLNGKHEFILDHGVWEGINVPVVEKPKVIGK